MPQSEASQEACQGVCSSLHAATAWRPCNLPARPTRAPQNSTAIRSSTILLLPAVQVLRVSARQQGRAVLRPGERALPRAGLPVRPGCRQTCTGCRACCAVGCPPVPRPPGTPNCKACRGRCGLHSGESHTCPALLPPCRPPPPPPTHTPTPTHTPPHTHTINLLEGPEGGGVFAAAAPPEHRFDI